MCQEGRAYMRDKLKGKKYGGKLKDKYKDELAKEAFKLSPKGKKFLKKELDKPKPHNKAEEITSIDLKDNDIIIVTGSLYLAGEVLNIN